MSLWINLSWWFCRWLTELDTAHPVSLFQHVIYEVCGPPPVWTKTCKPPSSLLHAWLCICLQTFKYLCVHICWWRLAIELLLLFIFFYWCIYTTIYTWHFPVLLIIAIGRTCNMICHYSTSMCSARRRPAWFSLKMWIIVCVSRKFTLLHAIFWSRIYTGKYS